MMLRFFWLFLAFIGLLSASPLHPVVLERRTGPADNIPVGYRQVNAAAVASYKAAGNTLTPQTNPPAQRVDQIGAGIYMNPTPLGWFNTWNCAIFADRVAWYGANKAWVPPVSPGCGKPLWGRTTGVPNIPEYLETLAPGQGWTAENTILLSYIAGFTPTDNHGGAIKIQILIPEAMLLGSNPLKLSVSCGEASTDVGQSFGKLEDIDWQGWPNLRGNFPTPGNAAS